MKKLLSIILSLCMCVFGVMCCVGCGEKPYVDTSNSAVPGQFDNPEAAKAKEKEDDAAGREHIQIPEGAETIEIDGEEYIPIDSLYIDPKIYGEDCLSKNYILTGDVDITDRKGSIGYVNVDLSFDWANIPFTGKFNGNNYKIYGVRDRIIFDFVDGAEISNFVLSSELTLADVKYSKNVLFCGLAFNSTIKNIVNYSCLNDSEGIIYYSIKCELDNIINYGNGIDMFGTIIRGMQACEVRNCKNYGNLSQNHREVKCFGAIVGIIWHFTVESLVENCENYGNLIGTEYVGGILGRVIYSTDTIDKEQLNNPSIIKDCNNCGDIYKDKSYSAEKKFSYIGGIVGSGPRIENCTNQGHIYGFESLDPQYDALKIGGIAGAAIAVQECVNYYDLVLDSAIKNADNICGYKITSYY